MFVRGPSSCGCGVFAGETFDEALPWLSVHISPKRRDSLVTTSTPPPWCVWLLNQTYMSISKRPLHSWIHFFFCFPHRLAGLAVLSPLSCSVSYSFRPSFTGVDTLAHILLVMIRHSIRWSRSSCRLLSSPDSNDFRPTVFFLFWLLSCAVVKVFSSRPPHFPLLNLSFLAQSLERDGFVYVAYQWCGSIHPPRFVLTISITPHDYSLMKSSAYTLIYVTPCDRPDLAPLAASSTSSLLTVLSHGIPWFLLFPRPLSAYTLPPRSRTRVTYCHMNLLV